MITTDNFMTGCKLNNVLVFDNKLDIKYLDIGLIHSEIIIGMCKKDEGNIFVLSSLTHVYDVNLSFLLRKN